jgi:PKD repeat protein/subtilisin family serine protease
MSKRKILYLSLAAVFVFLVFGSFGGGCYAANGASALHFPAKLSRGIAKQIEKTGQADFLLVLDDSDARTAAAAMRKQLNVRRDTPTIVAEKARLFAQKKDMVLRRISRADYTVLRDYDNFPVVYLRADKRAVESLARMGEVVSVSENRAVRPVYTDSQTLIGIPAAWTYGTGQTGTGTSVAVLDTGIDYTTSGFTACANPGADPGCIGYESCFATGGCTTDLSHGTNVSGVVFQVAPDAEVLSLDVFRTNGYAYYNDIISALNWVLNPTPAPLTPYNIVAVNLSLGGSAGYTSPCPDDGLASAISNLRAAGIATFVASGNLALTDALTAPACSPDAISVGAVYANNYGSLAWSVCTDSSTAADQVACFSDSASFLSLLAPGSIITAGGYTFSGTSQATPHAAGAAAVLQSENLSTPLTVDQVSARLEATGSPVTDSRNGIVFPRLDLDAAVSVTNPIILPRPSDYSFMAAQGGLNPAPQTMSVLNGGIGTMNWTFSPDPLQPWVTGSPASGTDAGTVTLSVDTSGLSTPGTYIADPQISAAGALNTPVTVPVTLQLVDPAYTEDFESATLTHKFPWVTGGSGSWAPVSGTGHTGSYAAQSPAMLDSQTSYMQVTLNVTSPGYVYFWLKTSTEPMWDNLTFLIDGTNQGLWSGWSGNTDWTFAQSQIEVTPGLHTFTWQYSKDPSVSQGSDAVWVDDIFFPPSDLQSPQVSISPASQDFGSVVVGQSSTAQTFTISNTGAADLVIDTVSLTGANPSDFTELADTCSGQTLTPSNSCTVDVEFKPGSGGSRSASLAVYSNIPSVFTAPLTGTAIASYALIVNKSGSGTGTVTSVPAGISCGAACQAAYTQGTSITLTATPDANSTFAGWSGGGCSGTGTCNVTMPAIATTVTATFNLIPPVADFTASPTSGPAPLTVNFTDLSTYNPTSWLWSFGDGNTSPLQNPSHVYNYPGTYSVYLSASNAGGTDMKSAANYITVSCPVLPARILFPAPPPVYFSSLQSAYNSATSTATIQLQAVTLTESPDLNYDMDLTIQGGYDPCYTVNYGTYTTINGSLTIGQGTITIENVVIR